MLSSPSLHLRPSLQASNLSASTAGSFIFTTYTPCPTSSSFVCFHSLLSSSRSHTGRWPMASSTTKVLKPSFTTSRAVFVRHGLRSTVTYDEDARDTPLLQLMLQVMAHGAVWQVMKAVAVDVGKARPPNNVSPDRVERHTPSTTYVTTFGCMRFSNTMSSRA